MTSTSTLLHTCRWDFCADTFTSQEAFRDHVRAHWQREEPQRVRIKRQKVAPGQWEAIPEVSDIATTFPLRHPGDTTTTTEGTTLYYPYPPSFPSQPPSLPSFLAAEDDADLYDEPSPSLSQGARANPVEHRGSPQSKENRMSNQTRNHAPPESQASASSRTALEPISSQRSGGVSAPLGTQDSQFDYEQIADMINTSFGSSLESGPSASATAAHPPTSSQNVRRAPEKDEWSCFLGQSPDGNKMPPPSSPFVAPTQPGPSQRSAGTSSNPARDPQMDLDEDIKPDISPPSLPASNAVPRSLTAMPKSKTFVVPRSTRPGPLGTQADMLPPHPASTERAKSPYSSSSSGQGSGSTPSWLGSAQTHPKPSPAVGLGRPSDAVDISRNTSNSSQNSLPRSDSYSQVKTHFGMSLSQGSDTPFTEAKKTLPAGGSPSVGFSWGQSR